MKTTLGLSQDSSICFTEDLLQYHVKPKYPLPKNTAWFDSFFRIDGHDCSDDEVMCYFEIRPHDEFDHTIGRPIEIFVGRVPRNRLIKIMRGICDSLEVGVDGYV